MGNLVLCLQMHFPLYGNFSACDLGLSPWRSCPAGLGSFTSFCMKTFSRKSLPFLHGTFSVSLGPSPHEASAAKPDASTQVSETTLSYELLPPSTQSAPVTRQKGSHKSNVPKISSTPQRGLRCMPYRPENSAGYLSSIWPLNSVSAIESDLAQAWPVPATVNPAQL